MRLHDHILIRILRSPADVRALNAAQWSDILFMAKTSSLLARLTIQFTELGIRGILPEKVQDHCFVAETAANYNRTRQMWELDRIHRAFRGSAEKIILLKGAAYACLDLPCARGRVSSDVDIMVARDRIEPVEDRLMAFGWQATKQDDYDQAYYRNWMHELPPLQHKGRGSTIDVHHTILPLTSRLKPDPEKLLAAARPVNDGFFRVLSPEDMVLHSAVHLFQDGALHGELRGLVDLHDLLNDFGTDMAFWDRLFDRAGELGLTRPLFYCCRYAQGLFNTPIPETVTDRLAAWAPPKPVLAIMDFVVPEALVPDTLFAPRRWRKLASFAAYMRSHWLRMPPLMLVRHLAVKAWRQLRQQKTAVTTPEVNQ